MGVLLFLSIFSFSIFYIQTNGAEPGNISDRFYHGDYDYGYANVRSGVFLFWWVYYAGGDKNTAFDKPLIIWIQGGPGNPASGMGNFLEIGPQDMYLNNRSLSWIHKRNVLFIDSPVATGFSYHTDPSLLVRTDHEIGEKFDKFDIIPCRRIPVLDLVELMKQFLTKIPKFRKVPTHIYAQSYGGKIAPRFALYLHEEIKAEGMEMRLESLGLGSSFVSPKDSVASYPEYLWNLGFIDQVEYMDINNISQASIKDYDDFLFDNADLLRTEMLHRGPDQYSLNLYNILKPLNFTQYFELIKFMNSTVKHALRDVIAVNNSYEFMSGEVFFAMKGDMMVPAIRLVERVLNETNMKVAVWSGNLDAITPLLGAIKWVQGLNWRGAARFKVAPRQPIGGVGNGYYKRYGKLSFWWIYNAGHSVGDNLEAMDYLLNVTVDSVDPVYVEGVKLPRIPIQKKVVN